MEAPHRQTETPAPTAAPGASETTAHWAGRAETPERTRALGRALAGLLRAGDLVLLTGELGAGKTTLTRGLGEGLHVRGAVTSPTFVIARVHPALGDGPPLVHVDAYRLGGGLEEMEDLDLDVELPASVVVVEWGEGRVEELTEDRLHVRLGRGLGTDAAGPDDEGGPRTVEVTGVGARWADVDLALLDAAEGDPAADGR